MADKKFSQFTNKATPTGNEQVVGLDAGNNVRLTISDVPINALDGTLTIGNGGTGATSAGVSTVGALLDEGSQVIGDSLIIEDDGVGNSVLGTGAAVSIRPPACQLVIAGTSGITNTNNGVDFQAPYNTTRYNDADYFNPIISGGLGVQGAIEVLQDGRYYVQARYSTYDLVQSSLPTLDGNKFLRITASVNGTKVCVLHNLVVATSGNGEAVATGSGVMDLTANSIISITAFHNGATGGNGSQGYPVSNNSLFNEPMLWAIKIG